MRSFFLKLLVKTMKKAASNRFLLYGDRKQDTETNQKILKKIVGIYDKEQKHSADRSTKKARPDVC